jgi:hypothetical protein
VDCLEGVLVVQSSPQTSSVGVLGDLSLRLKIFLMDAFFIFGVELRIVICRRTIVLQGVLHN